MTSVFGGAQSVPTTSQQSTLQNINQATQQNQAFNQAQASTTAPTSPWAQNMAPQIADVASSIYQQYRTPAYLNIAELTPDQLSAIGGLTQSGLATQPLVGQGAGYIGQGAGLVNQSGTPITAGDINSFYNPFAGNVTANLQNIFNQQALANRVGTAGSMGGVGAERAAVAQGLLGKQQGLAAGQIYSDLYQRALAAAQQQKAQQLGAGQALSGIGGAAIQTGMAGQQAGLQAAAIPWQQQQMVNQADYDYLMAQYRAPYERLQAMISAAPGVISTGGQTTGMLGTATGAQTGTLAGSQTGTGTGTSTTTYPAPSLFSQLLGLGTTAAGLFSLSDRRAKTDIQKIGNGESGIPLYAFRYKGDPKTYPKVIGPMAQDVAKVYPEAVQKLQYGGTVGRKRGIFSAAEREKERQRGAMIERSEAMQASINPWARLRQEAKKYGMARPGTSSMDIGALPGPPAMQFNYQRGGAVPFEVDSSPAPSAPAAAPAYEFMPQFDLAASPRGGAPSIMLPMEMPTRPMAETMPLVSPVPPTGVGRYQLGGGVSEEEDQEPEQDERKKKYSRAAKLLQQGAKFAEPASYPQQRAEPIRFPEFNPQMPAFNRPEGYQAGGNVPLPRPRPKDDKGFAGLAPLLDMLARRKQSRSVEEMWGPSETEAQSYRQRVQDELTSRAERSRAGAYSLLPAEREWVRPQGNYPVLKSGRPEDATYQEGGAVGLGDEEEPTPVDLPLMGTPEAREAAPGSEIVPLPMARPAAAFAPSGGAYPAPTAPAPSGGFLGGLRGAPGTPFGQSPAFALMQAGLGMLAASGQRDARGLPMAPLAAIGQGGMAGMEAYQQGQAQAQKQEMANRALMVREQAMKNLERHRLAVEQGAARPARGVRMVDPDTGENYLVNPYTGERILPTPTEPLATSEPKPENVPVSERHPLGTAAYSLTPGGDRPTIDPSPPPAAGGVSSNGIRLAAESYMQTGSLPPGMFRNKRAQAAIISYASDLAESRGMTLPQTVEMWRFAKRQAGWIMGADGRAAGSLGTLIDHLDTMRDLTKALKNGDNQTYNLIRNKVAKWTGSEYPTNVEAGAPIVGAEILKAVGAAGAGTGVERETAGLNLGDLAKSPQQFEGAITTVQRLAAGQLRTKYRQAESIGLPQERIKALVGKRATEVMESLDEGASQQPIKTYQGRRWQQKPGTSGKNKEDWTDIGPAE